MGHGFLLSLAYEWGEVLGLQPHVRTQKQGKLTPFIVTEPIWL